MPWQMIRRINIVYLFFAVVMLSIPAAGSKSIKIELENFSRYDTSSIAPPRVIMLPGTSAVKMLAVRSFTTGYPTWLEYDFTVEHPGLYELYISSGGNDNSQAALVSIDGGNAVDVIDRDRREDMVSPHLAGIVQLNPGRHTVRIAHGERGDCSNSFAFDGIEFRPVEEGTPSIVAGNYPPKQLNDKDSPQTLSLFTRFRYYGSDDLLYLVAKVQNNRKESLARCSLNTGIVLTDGRSVRAISPVNLDAIPSNGDRNIVQKIGTVGLNPGEYVIKSTLIDKHGKLLAQGETPLVIQEYKIPEWVKRARLFWQSSWGSTPPFWRSIQKMQENLYSFADKGATVVDNQCAQDYLNSAPPSYPLVRDFSPLTETCRDLGMKYIWYQTSCTASEYFYYQHRDWWTTTPFYTCGWLSVPPGCPKWSDCLGDDLGDLVSRAGIDGVMLDNACAIPPVSGKEAVIKEYEKIAEHLCRVREGIKIKKPLGALIPNFNSFGKGLEIASRGWDGQIIEGGYACSLENARGKGMCVRDFIRAYSGIQSASGKPVLQLCYARDATSCNISVAGTIAAGCTPGFGGADKSYYKFIDRYQDYFYAPTLIPVAADRIKANPADDDTAVAGFEKPYPGGCRDWVIHIINAGPEDRVVDMEFSLPLSSHKACLVSPENPEPRPVLLNKVSASTYSVSLKPGRWSVLLVTQEVQPVVKISPKVLQVTRGQSTELNVDITNPGEAEMKGTISFRLPGGLKILPDKSSWSLCPGGSNAIHLRLLAEKSIAKGEYEIFPVVSYGQREIELPYEVTVAEPIEMAVKPDHFAYASVSKPGITISVKNNGAEKASGTLAINAPAGWQFTPSRFNFDLNPGEHADFMPEIQIPQFNPPGFFDIKDYPLELTSITKNGKTTQTIPLRLHQPVVWCVTCNLGSAPRDIISTGAGNSPVSQFLFPVRGVELSDLGEALKVADGYLDKGENAVLWLRVGGASSALADESNRKALEAFVGRGGGLLLQENVFSASPENRAFMNSPVCPIEGPYQVADGMEAWRLSDPSHPAISVFAGGVPDGDIPVRQKKISLSVKPWAKVIARTSSGEPSIVVSSDPKRKVGYIAGSLEGKYLYEPDRRGAYRTSGDDLTPLTVMYTEILRWLGRPVK